MITLIDQHRTGSGLRVPIRPAQVSSVRLTIPARESLEASGAKIAEECEPEPGPLYTITLGQTIPSGLVVSATMVPCADGRGYYRRISLRMEDEPEWPGEEPAAYWDQLTLTPCPRCQAPLVWWEAGFVPGYRVCAGPRHHHWQAQ